MNVVLPEPRPFQQFAALKNGWSDHYGAFHVAAAYCERALPDYYRIDGFWEHGVKLPCDVYSAESITGSMPFDPKKALWVARQDMADLLKARGYPKVRPLGLPILYTTPSELQRQPRSLLIMPSHSLVGWNVPDRSLFERYADEMLEAARDFEHVSVCISPNCQKNGFWVKEFTERGFKVIYGAQTSDSNALPRIRMLCEQFETMTTNNWGSHVAYALAFGARVSIFGTHPAVSKENLKIDDAWRLNPEGLQRLFSPERVREKRSFLEKYLVPPCSAVTDKTRGEWLLGAAHKVDPVEMGTILQDMVSPLVAPKPASSCLASNRTGSTIRVLFVADVSGQEEESNAWLSRLLPELKKRGFSPRVLLFAHHAGPSPIAASLANAGIACDPLPRGHAKEMVSAIIAHIRANPCDLFVPNQNVAAYFASHILKAAGIPTVAVIRPGDPIHNELIEEFITKQPCRNLSAAVVVSPFQFEAVSKLAAGGIKVVKAPYGTPLSERFAHFSANPFLFLFVGQFVDLQGRIPDWLSAMIDLMRRQSTVHFFICGDGPNRPAVEALITRSGLGKRIMLLGFQSREMMQRILHLTQAFLLPSDCEDTPTALLEAMGTGVVPVCMGARGQVKGIIHHESNGLIVADRGEAFLSAAEQLINDEELWTRCSVEARATVEREFSIRANADTWASLLNELNSLAPTQKLALDFPPKDLSPPCQSDPFGTAHNEPQKEGDVQAQGCPRNG